MLVEVEARRAGNGQPGLPRRREPDLVSLAAFTLNANGVVASWPGTAQSLFGHEAGDVVGHDVCEVLMTGPGQRELVGRALADAVAGKVHTATVAGGSLGDGRFAFRWEPLAGPGDAVLVIAARAWPQPAPSWLSEATARIGSSLDLAQTASEVVNAAVPGFADATVIYAAERLLAGGELASPRYAPGAAVRRLGARLADYEAAVTDTLLPVGEVLFLSADTPRSQSMATGKPILSSVLDGETAARMARHPGGLQIASGYSSYLTMPLVARGVVVGCVTFGRAPASPAFNPGDIALAGELASRAAVCIDNARLYGRERRTAQALQQGLLPGRPQVPAGLDVAQVYVPVGDSVVGGDWHDIVPLSAGRAALIVGDAMGHGPEAAAVMVQLRTAAHTLADLELPPGQVLRQAGQDGGGHGPDGVGGRGAVRDVHLRGDRPGRQPCVVAQAGHLPPVLAHPGGETEVLDLPPGLPLGLGTGSFQATRLRLEPGATLALYTDGLVESRTRPIDDGLAALQDALSSALAEPGNSLEATCQTVTQRLREHGEDDITLMLARVRR